MLRVPGTAQHERSEVMCRRTGTVRSSEFDTGPGLQRVITCRAAPGTRSNILDQ